jgi:hypothetical protein
MKKTIGKKEKNNFTSGKIFFYICIIFICYVFIRYVVEIQLLKHYGICKKGIITEERFTSRYTNPSLMYRFKYKGEIFEGLSLTDNEKLIGDSICIVFLESYPSIRRPITFFDYNETKCNCK